MAFFDFSFYLESRFEFRADTEHQREFISVQRSIWQCICF